jgi:hypothetical protein
MTTTAKKTTKAATNGKAPETFTPADLSKELKVPSSLIRKVLRSKIDHEKGKAWSLPASDKQKVIGWVREATK